MNDAVFAGTQMPVFRGGCTLTVRSRSVDIIPTRSGKMTPAELRTLFGKSVPLSRKAWRKSKSVYLVPDEDEAQVAVVATPSEDGGKRALTADSGGQVYKIDTNNYTLGGRQVRVAGGRVAGGSRGVEKTPADSEVHAAALELSKVFGDTWYLSKSVVKHLEPGKHVFSIGGDAPAQLEYGDFAIENKKLAWSADGLCAELDGEPVFWMRAIQLRITAAS